MDVRCNRCGTEYEFDDALVSERGTTVKCTNCGHQFKVYPGGNRAGLPERWIVRKASGRELIYTSLKELQRAIAQRQVGTSDLLSRGDGTPMRTLGGIAELEPFFRAQTAPGPQPGLPRTLVGISPPSSTTSRPVEEDTIPDQAPPFPNARNPRFDATMQSAEEGAPATRASAAGVVPEEARTTVVVQSAQSSAAQRYPEPVPVERAPVQRYSVHEEPTAPEAVYEAKTIVASVRAPATQPVPISPTAASRAAEQRPVEPPPERVARQPARAAEEPPHSYEDDAPGLYPSAPPLQRSPVPWIFAALGIGVIILGATLGRKYVTQLLSNKGAVTATQSDARVVEMLRGASEAFNRGDFEEAKEQLDKATVLADRDPAVRSALARLEGARADVHWLAVKLVGTTDEAARQTEQKRLEDRLERVRRSADQAAALASNDPAVLRARIDAYRLGGDLAKARALVGSLASNASEPETAYVLAALDIAEASPEWSTVIDRLRTAEGVEGAIGRARAALIYALASSGQIDEAKAKLAKLSPTHPLADKLRAFVDRTRAPAGDAGAAAAAPAASVGSAPGNVAAGEAPGPAGMDFRKLLEEASRAKQSGDLARAQQFYEAAQNKQPGNIEALAGLGDVARARGDNAAAARYYDSVLATNPSYLPTLVARADQKWAAGDHGGAVTLYRKAVQQAGPGTAYSQHAQARIQEHEAQSGSKPAPPEPIPTEPAASPPAPAPSPTSESPGIDTSDLPGFQK